MHNHQSTNQRAAYVLASKRLGQQQRRVPLDCRSVSVSRVIRDEVTLLMEIQSINREQAVVKTRTMQGRTSFALRPS